MGDGAVGFCTKGLDSIRRFDKIQVLTPPAPPSGPAGFDFFKELVPYEKQRKSFYNY